MASSRRYEIGVGCLMLGAVAVLAFFALKIGALAAFGPSIELTARFTDASGMQAGSPVSISGVPIGEVDGLELEGNAAIVHFHVDPEAQVRKDASVRVRARSVLGEKYLELEPGNASVPLAVDGDRIASRGDQVEIDELVAMMAPLVAAIDPEQVRGVMDRFSKKLEEDPELIDRMIANADRLLNNAATASDELPAFVADGRSTLAQTRSTLEDVEARAEEAKPLLARADRILIQAEGVSEDLPALVAEIQTAVGHTNAILATVDENSGKIELILDNLSEIDKWELRRLLREEGILMRFKPREVDNQDDGPWDKQGKTKP